MVHGAWYGPILMVWPGMVHGMAWYGAWYGMVWHGMVHGVVRFASQASADELAAARETSVQLEAGLKHVQEALNKEAVVR